MHDKYPVSASTTGYLVHDLFIFFNTFLQKLQFCNISAVAQLATCAMDLVIC